MSHDQTYHCQTLSLSTNFSAEDREHISDAFYVIVSLLVTSETLSVMRCVMRRPQLTRCLGPEVRSFVHSAEVRVSNVYHFTNQSLENDMKHYRSKR